MSIFDSIKNAIFRHGNQSTAPAAPATHAAPARPAPGAPQGAAPSAPASTPSAAAAQVDIEAVLEAKNASAPQKLNWRSSIVDLMKLVGLDSGLENRKALAKELGYTGDASDSATMNIWLHRQVMKKLAENGGKLPASLQG